MTTSTRITRDPFARALREGDATIISVGQGKMSEADARPGQVRLMDTMKSYYGDRMPHRMLETLDSAGERGVLITPKLSDESARRLGAMFAQRSVMNGKREVDVGSGETLSRYDVDKVDTAEPPQFYTYLPRLGLYYALVPVKPHDKKGRLIRGYVARRRVR